MVPDFGFRVQGVQGAPTPVLSHRLLYPPTEFATQAWHTPASSLPLLARLPLLPLARVREASSRGALRAGVAGGQDGDGGECDRGVRSLVRGGVALDPAQYSWRGGGERMRRRGGRERGIWGARCDDERRTLG
jgi:hypothetical protein